MELKVYSLERKEIGKINVPDQFKEEIRPDLIKRAVLALQNNRRQPYGAKPGAGMRASAKLSRRRRQYRGSYGFGISRVPRKILSRRGTRMFWVGAVAPGTVGGRRAHPPKSWKIWAQKINIKERRKAIRSALASTLKYDAVISRGHKVPKDYPIVIDDAIESINSTKKLRDALIKLGFEEELRRVSHRKIRAGKGKMRGRRYIVKKGPLLVVSKNCSVVKAAGNIPGVDVATAHSLNAELLAPGATIARLTLYSKSAFERFGKERLFM